MNRFDRITALLVQLQAKRVVRGPALAAQFGVSLRTLYRDLRTLEAAGVPLYGEAGVGYSLAEGYRLPPVMFTREEATALLTAEKLAARLTDAHTAQLGQAAMDKLRAVLRRPDRDYLEHLSPHIHISCARAPEPPRPGSPDVHQRLLGAIAAGRVARLHYQAGSGTATARDVEPIGLYLGQHWHVVAYCRLRQEFRDFRLDRIAQLHVLDEAFAPPARNLAALLAGASRPAPARDGRGALRPRGRLPGARHEAAARLGAGRTHGRRRRDHDLSGGLPALPGGLAAAPRRAGGGGVAARADGAFARIGLGGACAFCRP